MVDRLKEMREKVKNEMLYIPRGDGPQMDFRMLYWKMRMQSLGKKAAGRETKADVIRKAEKRLREEYPDYQPQYNKEYFSSK